MGIMEAEFQEHLPVFTDSEAAAFFGAHGEIVSTTGRPGIGPSFVVALATRDAAFGPMALNPLAAKTLYGLLKEFVEKSGI